MSTSWRKCSSCKKELFFNQKYWACNVSTCNRSRTFLSFCSVSCWDAHLAIVSHRESWAEEKTAPTEEFWQKVLAGTELYPPRPPKEKTEPVPEKKPEGKKTIIRRRD